MREVNLVCDWRALLFKGFNEEATPEILADRDTRTTEIYAHFTDDARKMASAKTAGRIDAALSGQKKELE